MSGAPGDAERGGLLDAVTSGSDVEADVGRIGRLALEVGAANEPREVHRLLRDFVRDTTAMNGFFIARYDPVARLRTCVFAQTDGVEVDAAALPPLPMNGSPNSRAIEERQVVLVEDYQSATRNQPVTYVGKDVNPTLPQSSLVVPMIARGEVLGTMTIQSCAPRAFRERDVAFLGLAANLAALALENLELLASERDIRATLEERVMERTRALDAANRELREQTVARKLAQRLVQGVARKGRVRPEALRALGRELAEGMRGADVEEYVASFSRIGLGDLHVAGHEARRYAVEGRGLLERETVAQQPTCFLTLGFLEGAVAALHPEANGLGTEIACQSLGHAACRFILAVR